ncbi:hypothetical protein [Oceanobacillus sp. CAU 1775]
MSQETFTAEQVQEQLENAKTEWQTQELNPLITERDDLLQYKPKDKTDEQIAFEQQQADFFTQKVDFELQKSGLTAFKDVIKVENEEELNTVVEALGQIVKQVKLDSGYVPDNHLKDNEYDKFEKEGNVSGMIGSKLASLFK